MGAAEGVGGRREEEWLEGKAEVHDHIAWGAVNQPMSSAGFEEAARIATEYYKELYEIFVFAAMIGADPQYRLNARAYTPLASHSPFVTPPFLEPTPA